MNAARQLDKVARRGAGPIHFVAATRHFAQER